MLDREIFDRNSGQKPGKKLQNGFLSEVFALISLIGKTALWQSQTTLLSLHLCQISVEIFRNSILFVIEWTSTVWVMIKNTCVFSCIRSPILPNTPLDLPVYMFQTYPPILFLIINHFHSFVCVCGVALLHASSCQWHETKLIEISTLIWNTRY